MPSLKTVLNYTTVPEKDTVNIAAIIVCGGSSSRMNGTDKIFAPLGDKPLVAHTVLAFEKCEFVNSIVLVTKEESILKLQQLSEEYKFTKVTDIVSGGDCRQQSVLNGFNMLDDNTDIVLIHDGARPLVSLECIKRVADGAKQYSAVACAVKVKDTIKNVKSDGLVVATVDRSALRAVQTPQGFDYSVYKKAVDENINNLADFTDDCSLVESINYPVYTVEGDYTNIKITTPEDLDYAEFLLGRCKG